MNTPDLEKGQCVRSVRDGATFVYQCTGGPDYHIISSPETVVEDEAQPSSGKGTLPPPPPPNADRKLEGDGEAPCASHCRADADIWRLYLKETEAEDREVTELWNSSLDSLLVFVSQAHTLIPRRRS